MQLFVGNKLHICNRFKSNPYVYFSPVYANQIVRFPTYNLIHEYPIPESNRTIYHLDLYRLNDPEELYYLGVADLWAEQTLFLVEWPEKGKGILQKPDYLIEISKKSGQTEEIREFSICHTF